MENNSINTGAPVSYNQGGAKKKTSTVFAVLFFITTLGLGGAFAWAMLRENGGTSADKGGDTKCVVTQEQVNNPEEGSVAEVVADYDTDSYVRGLIRKINKKINEYSYPSSITKNYDEGVYYFADNYISMTSKSYSVRTSGWKDMGRAAGSGPEDYARRGVADILTSEGFTKDESAIVNKAYTMNEAGYYRKDDYICLFGADTSFLFVNCSSEKWFTDTDKELSAAVSSARGYNKDYYIAANSNYITKVKDGEYERADVSVFPVGSSVGGYMDLFYRKTDGGEWTYVTSVQGIPKCSDFQGDAVEAFAGEACQSEDETLTKVGE